MKTGIFGGTFDPVHNEHVKMAESVLRELQLDRLIIMPTYRPPHKTHSEGAPRTTDLKCAGWRLPIRA